jgi:hypothetical protein
MKTIAIWSIVALIVFGAMAVQVGLFDNVSPPEDPPVQDDAPPPPPKVVAKFPDDLAPAAQAKPVPAAAEYKPGNDVHRMIFLRVNGTVHPWQEALREDWQAETVAETELVVVVGSSRKQFISHHTYPNGAPPITRYMFEVEISVIEAKTGHILTNRLFRNDPRPINRVESWETTQIGRPVAVQQVAGWVQRTSKAGFPDPRDNTPIIQQAD